MAIWPQKHIFNHKIKIFDQIVFGCQMVFYMKVNDVRMYVRCM